MDDRWYWIIERANLVSRDCPHTKYQRASHTRCIRRCGRVVSELRSYSQTISSSPLSLVDSLVPIIALVESVTDFDPRAIQLDILRSIRRWTGKANFDSIDRDVTTIDRHEEEIDLIVLKRDLVRLGRTEHFLMRRSVGECHLERSRSHLDTSRTSLTSTCTSLIAAG